VDDSPLRYGVYRSGSVEPRRFIVFLNGRTEWIEKYDFLPEILQLPPGVGFLTWDHRGQGASGGRPAHIDHYDHFCQDASAVIRHVVGNKPYAFLGHSMGSLIALYATLKGACKPQFLVLSAPLLQLPNEPLPRRITKPISHLLARGQLQSVHTGVSSLRGQPFAHNILTHDPNAFQRLQHSPYTMASPTVGWVKASFAATEWVHRPEAIQRLNAPTLILWGSGEQVVDYRGFAHWAHRASHISQTEIEVCKIPYARHEILNEIPRYRDPAIAHINRWAERHHFFNLRPVKSASSS
jgi:lysophospholipase